MSMEASQFLDMAQVFLYNSSPSGRWANEGSRLYTILPSFITTCPWPTPSGRPTPPKKRS